MTRAACSSARWRAAAPERCAPVPLRFPDQGKKIPALSGDFHLLQLCVDLWFGAWYRCGRWRRRGRRCGFVTTPMGRRRRSSLHQQGLVIGNDARSYLRRRIPRLESKWGISLTVCSRGDAEPPPIVGMTLGETLDADGIRPAAFLELERGGNCLGCHGESLKTIRKASGTDLQIDPSGVKARKVSWHPGSHGLASRTCYLQEPQRVMPLNGGTWTTGSRSFKRQQNAWSVR